MSYPEIQSVVGANVRPGRQNDIRSVFVKDVSDEAIDTLVDYYRSVPSPP